MTVSARFCNTLVILLDSASIKNFTVKPRKPVFNCRNYIFLIAPFFLCACITNLPSADALKIGMIKSEAIKAMRQSPRRVSAMGELEVLHFRVAPHGALIADAEPFVIYTHRDHVIAFGHPAEFASPPTLRYEHIISGGQTNKHIMEFNTPAQPDRKPTPIRKRDNKA